MLIEKIAGVAQLFIVGISNDVGIFQSRLLMRPAKGVVSVVLMVDIGIYRGQLLHGSSLLIVYRAGYAEGNLKVPLCDDRRTAVVWRTHTSMQRMRLY